MILVDPKKDRYELSFGEVVFTISPLTWGQKSDAVSATTGNEGGKKTIDIAELSFKIVKYSVKGLKGIKKADGSDYSLEFENKHFKDLRGGENEISVLSDDCVYQLIEGLSLNPSLQTIAYQLLNGIPDEIVDNQGKKAKGVSIELVGKSKKKRSTTP